MTYIVCNTDNNEYEEVDTLDEAREEVNEWVSDGVSKENIALYQVSQAYEVVGSVKFKKVD